MTAAEARLVQRRYMRQQMELSELNAKAKRGESVDESTMLEIMNRNVFVGTSAEGGGRGLEGKEDVQMRQNNSRETI